MLQEGGPSEASGSLHELLDIPGRNETQPMKPDVRAPQISNQISDGEGLASSFGLPCSNCARIQELHTGVAAGAISVKPSMVIPYNCPCLQVLAHHGVRRWIKTL